MPKSPRLTREFLQKKGWKLASDVMYKDFRNAEDKLYRIGWNTETHIVYMGYGQLPFPVHDIINFAYILDYIGYPKEAYNLIHDIFEE